MSLATIPVKPYVALHLSHFPTETYHTPSGAEIHPMWSGEGNLSYMIVNPQARTAFLIDPDLEILGSYLLMLDMQALILVAVIDSHTHAEHATAAPALQQLLKVEYLMNHRAPSKVVTQPMKDNDERIIAGLPLQFMSAPGHTPDLQVILLDNHLFTGDSLFIRGCGRADFPVSDPGIQFDTLQRLKQLPDNTVIHPGHDYNNELSIHLGEARKNNKRLLFTNRNEFIKFMREFYQHEEKPENWEWFVAFNSRQYRASHHL